MKKGILTAISTMAGIAAGAAATGRAARKTMGGMKEMSDKHLALYLLMARWVEIKQEGKNLAEYFERNGYQSVAVYGMSYAGLRLLDELKGSGIEVRYGIDQRADEIYTDIDIFTVDDELPDVDVIVVTPVYFFDGISGKLSALTDSPVVSLEDILHEM